MAKLHLKRLAIPKSWLIPRKVIRYVSRPNPGPHSMEYSIPLVVALRDYLGVAKTTKEVKNALNDNKVSVDGKIRKDHKCLIGFMDLLTVIDKNYRLLLTTNGRLKLQEVDDKESQFKLSKIVGKSMIKDKMQLNFEDGRNILMDKKNDYKVGDSVLIKVPEQEIKDHIQLKEGNHIVLIGGKHVGKNGSIVEFNDKRISFKSEDGEVHQTLKKYAFAVGKDKPLIEVKIK